MTRADVGAIGLLGLSSPTKKSGFDVITVLRSGLDYKAFARVAKAIALEDQEVSVLELLGYSARTAQRVRTDRRRIEPPYADRLFRLARVVARAKEVFESDEGARSWLFRANRALAGKTPFELLDTEVGADEVERILGRIEHGVFS